MIGGWEMAFGVGALVLLLTLAYGVYHTRNTGRAVDPGAGEAAPSASTTIPPKAMLHPMGDATGPRR